MHLHITWKAHPACDFNNKHYCQW